MELVYLGAVFAAATATGTLVYRWLRAENRADAAVSKGRTDRLERNLADQKNITSARDESIDRLERVIADRDVAITNLEEQFHAFARGVYQAGIDGELGDKADRIVADFAADELRRLSGVDNRVLSPEFDAVIAAPVADDG